MCGMIKSNAHLQSRIRLALPQKISTCNFARVRVLRQIEVHDS